MSFDGHWSGTYTYDSPGNTDWHNADPGWQTDMGWQTDTGWQSPQYDVPWQPLGVNWQFPSDHLPVATVLEDGHTKCASWNVLDTRYVKLVAGQGLNGSMITQQDLPVGARDLTLRDASTLNTVLTLLSTVSVLALQECSQQFLIALNAKLAGGPIERADNSRFGDAVLLYNSDTLELHRSEMHAGGGSPFTSKGNRGGKPVCVAEFSLRAAGNHPSVDTMLRVVACKIAGDPSAKHLREYASFMRQCICPRAHMQTVLLGDFNFLEHEIQEAFWAQGIQHSFGWGTDARYPTNIQPIGDNLPYGFGGGPLAPKRIDHCLVLGNSGHQLLAPEQLLSGLGMQVETLCGAARSSNWSAVVPAWSTYKDRLQARAFLEAHVEAAAAEEQPPALPKLCDPALVLKKSTSQRVMVAATEELRRLGLSGTVSRKKARRILEMPEVAAAKGISEDAEVAAAVAILLSDDLFRVQHEHMHSRWDKLVQSCNMSSRWGRIIQNCGGA